MANIRVTFRVEYGVDLGRTPPSAITLKIPEACTVFNLVQIAQEHSERHSFKYRTFPDIGAEITTIDGIEEDPINGIYWFFYSPWNKLIPNGVSSHKLKHNTTVVARYERWTRTDHSRQKAPRKQFMHITNISKPANELKQKNDKNNNTTTKKNGNGSK